MFNLQLKSEFKENYLALTSLKIPLIISETGLSVNKLKKDCYTWWKLL